MLSERERLRAGQNYKTLNVARCATYWIYRRQLPQLSPGLGTVNYYYWFWVQRVA